MPGIRLHALKTPAWIVDRCNSSRTLFISCYMAQWLTVVQCGVAQEKTDRILHIPYPVTPIHFILLSFNITMLS